MSHTARCMSCSSALHEREDCPYSDPPPGLTPRRWRWRNEGLEQGETVAAR